MNHRARVRVAITPFQGDSMKTILAALAMTMLASTVAAAAPAPTSPHPFETSDDPRRVPVPPVDRNALPATVIRHATLLDGRGGPPIRDAVVIVRGDRIQAAGTADQISVPADAAHVIDARGQWLMPGMIDLHIHLSGQRGANQGAYPNSEAAIGIRSNELMESLVRAGITTVVDRGTEGDVALRLKEAVQREIIIGPRVFWSGAIITTTGGHTDEPTSTASGRWKPDLPDSRTYVADGAAEWRKAVRVQARRQADWIKVAAPFEPDEIGSAVEAAHDLGLRLTADSFGKYTIRAIEAGIDSIEHPLAIEPTMVPLMVKHKTGWNPTLVAFDYLLSNGYPSRGIPPHGFFYTFSRRFPIEMGDALSRVSQAWRAGVPIGVGTDLGSEMEKLYPWAYFRELELLAKSGMPIKAVLASATRVGAENLGLADKLGTIEPGKIADMILLERDPEADLANLRTVSAVIAGGKLIAAPAAK